jgi:vacuolar protein-sorting-associated protein 4
MNNTFIPQAVDIVKQAIDLDNAGRLRADCICPSIHPLYHGLTYVTAVGEYDKAIVLYRRALEYFMTGLKYEQNPASKKMILERVDGYMKRAEEIKTVLNSRNGSTPSSSSSSVQTISKDDAKGGKDEKDEEKNKLRGRHSCCACLLSLCTAT